MKRIFKYILASALPVFLIGTARAQMTAVDTVCNGETICVTTTSFNGTIQWQSSVDASTWVDIAGATNDTACFVINSNTYYRGVITENSCDPFFTDTSYFMVHNFDRVVNFNFTGGIQTFTVPADVCDSIFIQCWGAQGGAGQIGGNGVSGGNGGLGGYAEGFLIVNPGDVLNIFVGGQGGTPTGGFNGGANGGSTNAGGGGGASDVRVGGTAEANRVITAGGGGGGGRGGCHEAAATGGIGGNGGSGGGGVGADGGDSPTSGGVAGGGKGGNFASVQGALGAAGIGCSGFLGAPGSSTATGTGGSGGAGQTCCCSSQNSIVGGGGGGGGQIGGGGGGGGSAGTTGCSGNSKGAGGGGGGGSNFTGGVFNGATNTGIWLGNGQVTISY
jgi:hypothetical protein